MSNEEILSEIGKAMSMMAETKSSVNEALCHAYNFVKKYNKPTISEDTLEMERMKALNDGRNEVWELVKKATLDYSEGGYKVSELKEVFQVSSLQGVFKRYTPQEALAKLEAYEKEQAEIKVGDVVKHNGILVFVVTRIDDTIMGYDKEGNTHSFCFPNQYIKKTGKHIDIQSVLSQLAE